MGTPFGKRADPKPPLELQYSPPTRMVETKASGGDDVNTAGGGWQTPLWLGSYALWVDTTGDLRIKSSVPTTDLDGTVVGTQS